ncbi:inactive tyrosine-protein kinase 7-like [Physella acuta]|uniref:inactive tyrosine-protein kinase 7-like n=1 Tax=Physella acuta TaxID=109671 RepID=UPI0027DC94D7|nr:inactive tyrosine-protein kinase 7-like [Physella acuta]
MAKFLLILLALCLSEANDSFYFNVHPQSKSVNEGLETKLLCDVSDRRSVSFMWEQNGKPIVYTARKYQEDSNLRILRAMRDEDDGVYKCVATNTTSTFNIQSNEAAIKVLWIDKNVSVSSKRSRNDDLVLGDTVTLKCHASGNPEPAVIWFHNTFRLINVDRIRLSEQGSKLRIANISGQDNGVYSCKSQNTAGVVTSTENFLLNVYVDGAPHLITDKFTQFKLAHKHQDARLDCPFDGATRIDWFANYEKLSNSSRHVVYPNGSLYFPKVRATDEGTYRCEGLSANAQTAQTFTAELALADLHDITPQSFEPRLMTSHPIVIPVQVRSEVKVFPPAGRPQPDYRWLDRNDRVIGTSGRIHYNAFTNRLVFESPQEIDSGNYTFIANNSAAEKKQNVWIIVSVPPIISRNPLSATVAEDEKISFNCQVVGTPYPVTSILWAKDGALLSLVNKRYHVNPREGTLNITDVKPSDEGNYACVANTTGHAVQRSSNAYLKVTKKLKFSPPLDSVYYLELNKPAILPCKAEAMTVPRVFWTRGVDPSKKLPDHMTDDNGMLYVDKVQRSDEGRYTCVASQNKQTNISVTVTVKVVEKPVFTIRPQNLTTAYEGQPMMLHCVAEGDPKPKITWEKDNRVLSPAAAVAGIAATNKYTLYPNGTLLLDKVLMEDKGRYACTANNSAGVIRAEFSLRTTPPVEEDEGFDMAKTVTIAVCSAGAYLALVIGLTAYCSYHLLMQRKNRKQLLNTKNLKLGTGEFHHHREQHELLMKDRDSGLQFRSDSDNRSHVSGMSSHPSHSSASASAAATHITASAAARCRSASLDKFHFPRQDLQTLGIIGKGQFGDVFLAKARAIRPIEPETLVVVKSLLLKGEANSVEFHNDMEMYGKLEHPNVVRLLGVCREMEPYFMITEYCDWGDLKQFLLATRGDNGRRPMQARVPPLSSLQKLKMCQQVAMGMEYLAGYKFIHRDLAARNVLLTSRLDLKVCSLSLSRDVYVNEYFLHPAKQTLVPLRWLPPEAIRDSEFSFHTDIWSYGIFMWEVFHLCDLPYRLHSNDDIYKAICGTGTTTNTIPRLDFAEQCPSQMVDIVRQCCMMPQSSRPTFSDLVVTLGHILTNGDYV